MRTDRAKRLIERAERLKPIGAWVPPCAATCENLALRTAADWRYCKVIPCDPRVCAGQQEYRKGLEPVVETEGLYNLRYRPNEWLGMVSVNAYGAAVLNSKNLLFADIDFGDRRFSEYAGAADVGEVMLRLAELGQLDAELCESWAIAPEDSFRFAGQRWRVYSTAAGCRVVLASKMAGGALAPDGYLTKRLFRFLGADPCYARLCEEQQNFRARLTPKPWRQEGQVCYLEGVVGPGGVHPALTEQLALHDEIVLTRCNGN